MDEKAIVLGNNAQANSEELEDKHIKSKIHPDTLFHFMGKLEYLVTALRNECLSPRYCIEDISYLQLPIKKIAILMKCFCDINLHKLKDHVSFYGYYGIAFEKKWGIDQGIQPIQYVNSKSYLRQDFSEAFTLALSGKGEDKGLNDFVLHQMMYYKPYQGVIKNEIKCFTDECEWRYIPKIDASIHNFTPVFAEEPLLGDCFLSEVNNSIENHKDLSLVFDYSNIKYLIVKEENDRVELINQLDQLEIDGLEKTMLISKIIVWEQSEGDF